MAKYDAEYSCGHSATVDLIGKHADRERKLEWYKWHGRCPDCYEAERLAAREAENATAAQQSAEQMLPDLAGSEKQIAWAMSIRAKTVAALDGWRINRHLSQEDRAALLAPLRRWFLGRCGAKWWIDHRHYDIDSTATFGELLNRGRCGTKYGGAPALALDEATYDEARVHMAQLIARARAVVLP